MPVFVALGRMTDEGIKNLGGFTPRHEQAVKRAQAAGGRVLASYALTGRYDFLVILETPDVQTALKILTEEAKSGNIRYETMTAIPVDEFAKLM